VEVIRDNEKWIDSTMGLLNFAKRKTNTYEAMVSTLSDLKGNSDLPRKCIAALTVIKDSICSIQKAYSSEISLTELTNLVLQAKALSVRPPQTFYKDIKFHLKLCRWLESDAKVLTLEEVDTWL